ncbi:hypothetical protein LIER_20699 [Lithospermum erythrorhizon]|uniref:Hydroxyproline-rich glycoprotein family protein n=1 Tax=Lithospermum erythrorhizon TaxID=34254 RepID=A0AAV3QPW4_LITER
MMISGNNNNAAFETINAAATAIVTAENRVPQAASQKRRSFWSLYWCFGSVKGPKRIGHAAIIPDTTAARVNMAASDNPTQTTSIAIPFAAPPSSPDSFRPSEPPSSIQSPTGLLSLSSMAANMYSPRGPASMFTIGPFAYETQLVTPPAFSTYTTQPSTASYTPPPESVHFTTPSSPEVPFARLLDPIHQNTEAGPGFPMSQYEFQSYLLQPGSPVSNLISPCSGISGSGTLSPFPDHNYGPTNPHFLEFRNVDHSKNLNLEKLYSRWESQQGSGSLTPEPMTFRSLGDHVADHQSYVLVPDTTVYNGWTNDETALDPRVSFEIASEVVRCAERKSDSMNKVTLPPSENLEQNIKEERKSQGANSGELSTSEHFTDGDDGRCHKRQRSITLSCAKEFNFDSIDGGTSDKSSSRSNWWANEKVLGQEVGTSKNWSFSPVIQSGVS